MWLPLHRAQALRGAHRQHGLPGGRDRGRRQGARRPDLHRDQGRADHHSRRYRHRCRGRRAGGDRQGRHQHPRPQDHAARADRLRAPRRRDPRAPSDGQVQELERGGLLRPQGAAGLHGRPRQGPDGVPAPGRPDHLPVPRVRGELLRRLEVRPDLEAAVARAAQRVGLRPPDGAGRQVHGQGPGDRRPVRPGRRLLGRPGGQGELANNVIDTITEYAPNFRDAIIDKYVFTPLDFERVFGNYNWAHVDVRPDQMFGYRPMPGWSGYQTPMPGLYLGGASTHGGPAVSGVPGHNVAQIVIESVAPALAGAR